MPEYRLFWEPDFYFARPAVRAEHAERSITLQNIVRRLAQDIERKGMRNPLFVTVYDDFFAVHPGKCRVKALKMLGFDTAPALLYVPSGVTRIPSGTPISPADAAGRLKDDLVAEYDERFFAVKRSR